MPANFLSDYVFYNSGNEAPQIYHIWSALTCLSTVLSRRVWINRDYFKLYPNIYVVLVGDAGSGKGTARDCAVYELLLKNFPNIPISASVTSREDVSKFMGSEECLRTFRHPDGSIEEYRPFFFSVSELSNLLSVDMRKMIDFLVDLYDTRSFSTSFKKDTVKDKVPNPCATMLACCVPDWFMRALRMDLFTGGLGRRLIIVYENRTVLKAHPAIPKGGREAWERVVAHVKLVSEASGEIHLSPEADKWWTTWYENDSRLKTDDPLLRQLFANKHVILQKVATLLSFCETPFTNTIEPCHLIQALALLDMLEPAVKKLSIGIGRNELATVALELIEMLQFSDGRATEISLRRRFFRDCKVNGREFDGLVEEMLKSGQIYATQVVIKDRLTRMVWTPEAYEAFVREQQANAGVQSSTSSTPPSDEPQRTSSQVESPQAGQSTQHDGGMTEKSENQTPPPSP